MQKHSVKLNGAVFKKAKSNFKPQSLGIFLTKVLKVQDFRSYFFQKYLIYKNEGIRGKVSAWKANFCDEKGSSQIIK